MAKRRLMNQINIVPYVDVMLVLLVIFMVTAPLPSSPPIEITVHADTSLSLKERVKSEGGAVEQSGERSVTMPEMLDAVRALQGRNPDQPVVIAADKNVRYEGVMKVMDELQRANIRRVGLLVKPAGS